MDKLTINDNDLLGWKDDKQILLDIKEGNFAFKNNNRKNFAH
jgi:hypothetical protein